jgi:hypothetical protein
LSIKTVDLNLSNNTVCSLTPPLSIFLFFSFFISADGLISCASLPPATAGGGGDVGGRVVEVFRRQRRRAHRIDNDNGIDHGSGGVGSDKKNSGGVGAFIYARVGATDPAFDDAADAADTASHQNQNPQFTSPLPLSVRSASARLTFICVLLCVAR